MSYGRGFDLGRYFEVFFSNLISRILGALMRSFLIAIGTLVEGLVFCAGIIMFFGWLFLPIISILSFILGLIVLF